MLVRLAVEEEEEQRASLSGDGGKREKGGGRGDRTDDHRIGSRRGRPLLILGFHPPIPFPFQSSCEIPFFRARSEVLAV